MKDLNNVKWQEFRIGDLFEVRSSKKIFHKNELTKNNSYFTEYIKNSYPYITRSEKNNGLAGFVVENTKFLNPSNVLSFAQDTFCIFYQKEPFFTGNKVKVLIPKNWEINQNKALFVSIVFQKVLQNFSWGVGNTENDILDFKILLPIISKDEIDFEFMENYMKQTFSKMNNLINLYKTITASNNVCGGRQSKSYLNSVSWKKFKIGEIFTHIVQGARLKKADHISGDLPFVMAGFVNNGISSYIGNSNVRKFKSNSITIDILGNVFYRNYDFGASDDVGVYWNDFSPKAMLFLSAVCQKAMVGRFDFGKKLRASQSHNIKILLPINSNGDIDFNFMQNFISAIQKLAIKNVAIYAKKELEAYKKAAQ